MSLEIQERLKRSPSKGMYLFQSWIRNIIDKHLGPEVEDGTIVDTVILKIPADLRKIPQNWKNGCNFGLAALSKR